MHQNFISAAIDDCTEGSCSNEGQCEDGHQTFTCNCEGTGFTGDRCQTGKCAYILLSFTCNDEGTGYTGDTCQTANNVGGLIK